MFEWILNGGGVPEVIGEWVETTTFTSGGRGVALSADGELFTSQGDSGQIVVAYVDGQGSTLNRFNGTGTWGESICLAPDGSILLISDPDNKRVMLYKRTSGSYSLLKSIVGTGAHFGIFATMTATVDTLLISDGGKSYIYKHGGDFDYVLVQTFNRSIRTASFSSDGNVLAYGESGRWYLYGRDVDGLYINTNSQLGTSNTFIDCKFINNDDRLYLGGNGGGRFAEKGVDGVYRLIPGLTVPSNTYADISQDGVVFVTSGGDTATIYHYNSETGKYEYKVAFKDIGTYGRSSNKMCKISDDGTLIIVGDNAWNRVHVYRYK